jgi:hypothetical protein
MNGFFPEIQSIRCQPASRLSPIYGQWPKSTADGTLLSHLDGTLGPTKPIQILQPFILLIRNDLKHLIRHQISTNQTLHLVNMIADAANFFQLIVAVKGVDQIGVNPFLHQLLSCLA